MWQRPCRVPCLRARDSSSWVLVDVGVAEAAAQLGVSPQRVRQLVQEGLLPARRIGGRWVFDTRTLARRAENRRPGRPLSPRVAWGLIGLLESGQAPDL